MMVHKLIGAVLLSLTLCLSCSRPEIGGTWEGGVGQTLYLSDAEQVIDSARVDEQGQFAFAYRSDSARIFTLKAGDAAWLVYLDGVRMQIALSPEEEGDELRFDLQTDGPEQRVMHGVAQVIDGQNRLRHMIEAAFTNPEISSREAFEQIVTRADSMRRAIDAQAAALTDTTAAYAASMAVITEYYLGEMLQLNKAKEAFLRIDSSLRNTPVWRHTAAKIDHYASVHPGGMAPDIALPTPQGDTLRLSELRGKWVLIDFWASWCAPCMQEMPILKALYDQYHAQGLEIYGVSSDTQAAAWTGAIEREQLIWHHVSGLKDDSATAVRKRYMVMGIPCILLIDPQGRIFSRGQRGEELRHEVARLFKTGTNP